MGMFIEVDSAEKNCPVIINLDHVIEVAPLAVGGCEIKMSDDGVSKSVMTVKNDYSEFKQFAMQTVSSEDIAKRIEAINKSVTDLYQAIGPITGKKYEAEEAAKKAAEGTTESKADETVVDAEVKEAK
mgnify:CR=1 FL=1